MTKKSILFFTILLVGIVLSVFLINNKPKVYDYMIAKEMIDFENKSKMYKQFIDSLRTINSNTINGFSNIFCYLELETEEFSVNITPLDKGSLELINFKQQVQELAKKYMIDNKIKSIGGEFNTNEIIQFDFYSEIDFKLVYSKNRAQQFEKFSLRKEYLYDGEIDRWVYLYDDLWMLFQQ